MTPQDIIAKTKLRYSRLSTPVLADVRVIAARVPHRFGSEESPVYQDGFKVVCITDSGRTFDFLWGTLQEIDEALETHMETDPVDFADRYIGG